MEISSSDHLSSPASNHTQEQEHQRHPNQETQVIFLAIIVNFVHLHIGVEK